MHITRITLAIILSMLLYGCADWSEMPTDSQLISIFNAKRSSLEQTAETVWQSNCDIYYTSNGYGPDSLLAADDSLLYAFLKAYSPRLDSLVEETRCLWIGFHAPEKGKHDTGVAEDTCVEFTYYCKAFTSFGLYKNIIYSKTPPHSELIDGKDLNEVFFARHDSDSYKMVDIYKPIDKNWYIRIQYFP